MCSVRKEFFVKDIVIVAIQFIINDKSFDKVSISRIDRTTNFFIEPLSTEKLSWVECFLKLRRKP